VPPPPPETGPAPSYPAAELDRIVSPIALYPDPLLAQVLAAATFAQDIPDAARWADEHHNLTGAQLTAAIADDRLPWDPSVQALLPFPSVLEMMASAMPWTQEIGDAFLAQRADVMDAVQRQRQNAQRYGYLQSNGQVTVSQGPYIEILPIDPGFICVPYYDPYIVFGPPPPGFFVGGLRIRRADRNMVRTVGLGHDQLRMGHPRIDHQPRALGPHMGQPRQLYSPVSRRPAPSRSPSP
jgi:hypothetical protein